jgi:predicted methyltransferase
MTIRATPVLAALLGAALAAPALAQGAMPQAVAAPQPGQHLVAAVNAPNRTPANRERDRWRNPAQTLAFFGLQPGMTVVEVSPGAGWYTEILAPAVGPRGKLYVAAANPAASENAARAVQNLRNKFASDPVYSNIELSVFTRGSYDIAPPGSADLVLTFRNVHNWMANDFAQDAFNAFYRALKPGGVLGVVEHRLPESRDQDPKAASGYVKESEVVRMAQAAGFVLEARSDVNANPRDTADHPGGVWSLPPILRGGDVDRDKYMAIGESDRMTLRFRKPAR